MLLFPHLKCISTPLSVTAKSFEHHYVMLTDPIKAFLVVLYCPPGPPSDFVEELDMILSKGDQKHDPEKEDKGLKRRTIPQTN